MDTEISPRMPGLNQPAPAFTAPTTHGGAHGVATPENWKPGDKVIVPPPKTMADAAQRMNEGYECVDWYFCKKAL